MTGTVIPFPVSSLNWSFAIRTLHLVGLRRSLVSTDGRNFVNLGILLEPDPDPAVTYDDQGGVTNPGWVIDGSIIKALMYAGSTPGLEDHKLGIAFPQLAVTIRLGETSYTNRQSLAADQQRVGAGVATIDRVQAQETTGGHLLIDQAVSASAGAVYLIQPGGAPTATAGPLPTPAPTPTSNPYADAPRVNASASSTTDPFVASNGIDDDTATFWSSTWHENSAATEWFVVDIGTTQNLGRVRLIPRPLGYGFPQDFKFQVSNDGTNWIDIPGQNYVAYADTFGAEQAFTFNPVSARYVRMYATRLGADDQGDWYFQLLEIYPQTFSR